MLNQAFPIWAMPTHWKQKTAEASDSERESRYSEFDFFRNTHSCHQRFATSRI